MGDLGFAKCAIPSLATALALPDFRRVLSRYPTGVAVVTTVDENHRPYGLAVNSFASVSMEPPLVLWCLRTASSVFAPFASASTFCINVLAADQLDLVRRFAAKTDDRFAGLAYELGLVGCPVLPGVAATLECGTVATHVAGDHFVFIGEVRACSETGAAPLIFHSSKYWTDATVVHA